MRKDLRKKKKFSHSPFHVAHPFSTAAFHEKRVILHCGASR